MAYIIAVELIIVYGFVIFLTNIKASFNTKKTVFLTLSFLTLALIMGLRAVNVGLDTNAYKIKFDIISEKSFGDLFSGFYYEGIEIGYVLLMKFVSLIGGNYLMFQILTSFLYCFGMAAFIRDNTGDPFTAVSLFMGTGLFLFALNGARQMFAVMLIANSWTYLKNKNYAASVALFLVSIFIHLTSIVFLLVYFCYFLRNRENVINFVPLVLLVCALFYKEIAYIISCVFPKYKSYLNFIGQGQDVGFVVIVWYIIVTFSLYIIYGKKKFYEKGKFNSIDKTIAIFSFTYFLLYALSASLRYIDRVAWFFMPFLLILFETVGKGIEKTKWKNLYFFGLNICFVVYFLISTNSEQYIYSIFQV